MRFSKLGLVDQLEPTPMYNGSAYDHFYELPQGLPQALTLLRQEDRLRDVLGERFVDVFHDGDLAVGTGTLVAPRLSTGFIITGLANIILPF